MVGVKNATVRHLSGKIQQILKCEDLSPNGYRQRSGLLVVTMFSLAASPFSTVPDEIWHKGIFIKRADFRRIYVTWPTGRRLTPEKETTSSDQLYYGLIDPFIASAVHESVFKLLMVTKLAVLLFPSSLINFRRNISVVQGASTKSAFLTVLSFLGYVSVLQCCNLKCIISWFTLKSIASKMFWFYVCKLNILHNSWRCIKR